MNIRRFLFNNAHWIALGFLLCLIALIIATAMGWLSLSFWFVTMLLVAAVGGAVILGKLGNFR